MEELIARADQLVRLGDPRAALRLYFDALELAPGWPPLLERLAHTLYAAGQPREARCYFAALAGTKTDDEQFLHAYVNCLRAAHDLPAARAFLERLVASSPETESHRLLLADVLADLGLYAQAAALLLDGLGEVELSPDYYARLGALLAESGSYEVAEEAYRAVLVVQPHGPAAAAAEQVLRLLRMQNEA